MTRSNPIPACFSWNAEGANDVSGEVIRYSQSQAVRELLVLLALSGSKLEYPEDLEFGVTVAFTNVCDEVNRGLIKLDYHPMSANVVDIPPMDDANYMQALLFWSCRLDCTLDVLAEAHSRLGSTPAAEVVWGTVRGIEREDAQTDTSGGSARGRQRAPATVEIFAHTNAMVFS